MLYVYTGLHGHYRFHLEFVVTYKEMKPIRAERFSSHFVEYTENNGLGRIMDFKKFSYGRKDWSGLSEKLNQDMVEVSKKDYYNDNDLKSYLRL